MSGWGGGVVEPISSVVTMGFVLAGSLGSLADMSCSAMAERGREGGREGRREGGREGREREGGRGREGGRMWSEGL